MDIDKTVEAFVCGQCGADSVVQTDTLQGLWSGYGTIARLHLRGSSLATVVVKLIAPPASTSHPRGWNTDFSHQRKLKSYQVEAHWYENLVTAYDHAAGQTVVSQPIRLPRCHGVLQQDDITCLVLEDLDPEYPDRVDSASMTEAVACLEWLAGFHACHVGCDTTKLWAIGTYWHLDTRPDEYEIMAEGPIKQAAVLIDRQLNGCEFMTLVHGDAKIANFCFSSSHTKVTAVDFQYVGGGCGIKDVVYFLGSCLSSDDCQQHETELLNVYFEALSQALEGRLTTEESRRLCAEWRGLYAIAWTDFYRFLLGWMPDHHKVNDYTQILAEKALEELRVI